MTLVSKVNIERSGAGPSPAFLALLIIQQRLTPQEADDIWKELVGREAEKTPSGVSVQIRAAMLKVLGHTDV